MVERLPARAPCPTPAARLHRARAALVLREVEPRAGAPASAPHLDARESAAGARPGSISFRLDLEQLIAEARSGLEIQGDGGFFHLILELCDELRRIHRPVRRRRLGDSTRPLPFTRLSRLARICHASDEAHLLGALCHTYWNDAVRGVVRPLHLTAPSRLADCA